MIMRDKKRMAVFTMMGLSSYARPSELMRCKKFSLVRPVKRITSTWSLLMNPEERQVTSKTGDFDTSVLLDSPYLRGWSNSIFENLKEGDPTEDLWDFDYAEYVVEFQTICNELKIPAVPYEMRHSGPSIDRSRNTRSPLEVQKRGQWKTTKSVARYEKAARLAATFDKLPLNAQTFCQQCEEALMDAMSGKDTDLLKHFGALKIVT